MKQTILEKASEFITSASFGALPESVRSETKKALIDYIGCAVAGSREPVSNAAVAWAQGRNCVGEATVLGRSERFAAPETAFCNGTIGHALDYDDCSTTSLGHPTTIAGPAVLALGEIQGRSGKDLITAYAVGVEVGHKLAVAANPETSERGWHTTSVFGVPMAAAATCYLMGANVSVTCNGLGISLSRSSGLRNNFGTMTKPLHAGLAVLDGMESAGLAACGITSSPLACEGKDGFIDCFSGVSRNLENIVFGKNWDLEDPGIWFKPYPCCSGAHAAVDAISEAINAGGIRYEDVASIHVGCSLLAPRELVESFPEKAVEARFSMQYALAARLIYGELGIAQYTDEKVNDPGVRKLMNSITMEIHPELAKRGFIADSPVIMTITRKDGSTLTLAKDIPRGLRPNRFTDKDIADKFLQTATRYLPETKARQALDQFLALESVQNIKKLMRLLVP